MHRDLAALLPKATGVSEFVIALNVDIRGFSSFAKLAESSEAALFLKKVYLKLITEYFEDASFFKPTGDGLLIVQAFEEEELQQMVTGMVTKCLSVVTAFPHLLDGDPMINFDVPRKIGIGLTRGAATRLVSNDKILDYSGRPLNLASRLMDLARPSGIVMDKAFAQPST
jgi:class 3 adenylate cyclase